MGNFKGEKKKNKSNFKLLIIFWDDEILRKNEIPFQEYEDALNFDVDIDCQFKIYDHKDRLIYSKHKEKKPHKHQHGKGHHHHEDDYI